MKDKELLLEAIDDYDIYPPRYRKVLYALITVSIDNLASISAISLHEATNIAQNQIYIILRDLEKEGTITRIKKPKTKNTYMLNQSKLDQIIDIYNQKQVLLKK